jgi:hypothetical protein
VGELRATIEQQTLGYFTVNQAAQVLADAVPGVDARTMAKDMLHAYEAGEPREFKIRRPADKVPERDTHAVRSFTHMVKPSDVDALLASMGVHYRFPMANHDTTPAESLRADFDDVPEVDMKGAQRYKNENVTRNATGRYSILEAMEVLYATHGESVRTPIGLHIGNALTTGLLVVLDSVDGLPVHGRRAPQPFGDIVTPAAIDAWLEADGFAPHIRWPTAGTVTTGAKVPNVVPAVSGPQPVPTSDMAASFSGLRWDGKGWLKTLGNKPRWLDACLALGAARGEGMRLWNPVLIGAYLVNMGHAKANSVRAKFQSQDALKPWLDEWKTYEADNFPAD